jgi:hypothetical protein
MSFAKLSVHNPLFDELSTNPPSWWKRLVSDSDINIQVRKDNYIDVYYNGGAIIKELKYSKQFTGKIHFEYIPIKGSDPHPYVKYKFDGSGLEIDKAKINILDFHNFQDGVLTKIKKRISSFYGQDSEKGIQATFIKNDPYYIDCEFEYRNADDLIRIDLVRIDKALKKIVFIELKTIWDPRLFSGEISKQLEKYGSFIRKYRNDLRDYYQKVFEIKKKLKILTWELASIDNFNQYTVLDKPLLLLGDCTQEWIGRHDNAKTINARISKFATGCYYFGKPRYRADIVKESRANRFIFNDAT